VFADLRRVFDQGALTMIGTSNPVLNQNTFAQLGQSNSFGGVNLAERSKVMTIQGAVNASFILLSLCVGAAAIGWWVVGNQPSMAMPVFIGSTIVGLIMALIITFKPTMAPFVSPLYALVTGTWVGGLSFMYAAMAAGTSLGGATGGGIIAAAGGLTFAVLFAMLLLYKFRIIRATAKFKACIGASILGVVMFSVVTLVLSLFGVPMGWLFSGPLAIVISAVIVAVASFALILDFDTIEQGAAMGAPRYMEWYAGFGLLVTLVWLYTSILRLLSILNRRE